MPLIMVTSAITTVFEVPEGVDISRVRQLGLSELGDDESATDAIPKRRKALKQPQIFALQ